MTDVTVKVLLDLNEYERLKSIDKAHKNCQQTKEAISKEGSGTEVLKNKHICDSQNFGNCPIQIEPNSPSGDNRVTHVIDNPIVSEKPISMPSANSSGQSERFECDNRATTIFPNSIHVEDEILSPISYEKPLSEDSILSVLQKRYRIKGQKLLQELKKHINYISFDQNGVVSIQGSIIQGLNILDALPSVFYQVKCKEISGLKEWYEALKHLGLSKFVTNSTLRNFDQSSQTCDDQPWYFLGKMV